MDAAVAAVLQATQQRPWRWKPCGRVGGGADGALVRVASYRLLPFPRALDSVRVPAFERLVVEASGPRGYRPPCV